jgi:hypothetical protein
MVVQETIRERLYWIAGFDTIPAGRLEVVGQQIFAKVYPETVPFPFDGFASAAGGGPADATQLARGLIARQVTGTWVQALPKRLQNRVDAVLSPKLEGSAALQENSSRHWKHASGFLSVAGAGHQDDPQRTLLASYRALIAPPYGLNASSASLLLGLLLGIGQSASTHRAGRCTRRLRRVARVCVPQQTRETSSRRGCTGQKPHTISLGRQREPLAKPAAALGGGAELRQKISLAREAARMREIDPLPENLEGNYNYLRDTSNKVAEIVLAMENKIREWERGIELATRKASVEHAIRLGGAVLDQRNAMQDSPYWPETYVNECNSLLDFAKEVIIAILPLGSLAKVAKVPLRSGTFAAAPRTRRDLYPGWALCAGTSADQQAQRCIHTVEAEATIRSDLGSMQRLSSSA